MNEVYLSGDDAPEPRIEPGMVFGRGGLFAMLSILRYDSLQRPRAATVGLIDLSDGRPLNSVEVTDYLSLDSTNLDALGIGDEWTLVRGPVTISPKPSEA